MLQLISFLLTPAFALISPSHIVTINSPQGLYVLNVSESAAATSAAELQTRLLPQATRFTFRRQFADDGKPIAEQSLPPEFRRQADVIVSRFVKLAVGLMRLNGVRLDVERGTAVRYEAGPTHVPGRTTPGLIDACWECYGAAGNREYVAHSLGLDVGSLEDRVSLNPRFTRQLFRGSAALYKITLNTVERGEIKVGLNVELDESYQPFVADVPVVNELYGQRILGTSQRLRLTAEAYLDPIVFGVDHVAWTEHDQFGVLSTEMPSRPPRGFVDVVDHAAPDQAKKGFVPQMLRDLNEHVRGLGMMTTDHLELPGSKSWFE